MIGNKKKWIAMIHIFLFDINLITTMLYFTLELEP